MRTTVIQLREIEKIAFRFYQDASVFFSSVDRLSELLKSLAQDEAFHYHFMGSAAEYLRSVSDNWKIVPTIRLDKATTDGIKEPFVENQKLLDKGELTPGQLVEAIVEMEFSEWNDIFLHVLKVFKEREPEFSYLPGKIEEHRKKVENFVLNHPDNQQLVKKLRRLPCEISKNFLIVDDFEPLVELLTVIFEKEAFIETASNGREGLEKFQSRHYDLIISDVDMPVMNGIEFFKEAKKDDPDLKKRILFFTGVPDPETKKFFEKNDLEYLEKPANITEIKKSVSELLSKNE